jgi:hypothetical protein
MPKQCRHILTSGAKCHAIALRDKPYCYHHMRVHRLMAAAKKPSKAKEKTFDFDFPDSMVSIQSALYQVMNAIGSSQVSPQRAGSLLYSLQIASQNVDRSSTGFHGTVHCITQAEDGDELGPDCEASGPGECGECVHLEECRTIRESIAARSAGQSGKPMRTLPEMFKDAFLRNLSGLSSERYEKFRDMSSESKELESELPRLSSLLKS